MDTAVYRIPFIYQTAAICKGGRKIEPFLFGAWTEVRIPHVTPDEAPVSMSWYDLCPGHDARLRQTRWFENSNWEPCDPGTAFRAGVPFHAGDFARLREIENEHVMRNAGVSFLERLAMATGQDYYSLRSFVWDRRSSHRIAEFDPRDIRETFWCGRAEAETAVANNVRNLLFVDGELWVKGGEPHYGIQTQWNSRTPEGAAVISPATDIYRNHSAYHNSFFRADRLDDAVDFVRHEHGADAVRVESRIEILISEAVQFDDEGELLDRTARQAIGEGMASLRTCSTEQALAWLALRDCYDRRERTSDQLAECLREFGDAAAANPAIGLPVGRTMRRWDLRPMEMEGFAP